MIVSIRSPDVFASRRARPSFMTRSRLTIRACSTPQRREEAEHVASRLPTKLAVSSLLGVTLPLAAATAAVAMKSTAALAEMDTLTTTTAASTAYVPSPLEEGDGMAQLVVVLVCAVCGMVGMLTSFEGEQTASDEVLTEKVAAQVAAMRNATSGPVVGTPADEVASGPAAAYNIFDIRGLLHVCTERLCVVNS